MKVIASERVRFIILICSLWLMHPFAEAMASIGPFGGTVDLIVVDSGNPNTVYANATGLFKSVDGGASWLDTGFREVSSLVVDPQNSDILYAGTSETGVFKSTDGGKAWSATSLGDRTVSALALNPVDPSTVYAGTLGGGVFRSINGGVDWLAINTGLTNLNIKSLAIDPENPKTIYAGTFFSFGDELPGGTPRGSGVFKSTDGGDQWDSVGPYRRVIWSLVIDPQNSDTLFAAVGSPDEVYKSTDGGAHWSIVNDGVIGLNVRSLAMDPKNTDTVYAGTTGGIYRTLDSGGLWLPTALNTGEVKALAIPDSRPTWVYAGLVVRGAFQSLDRGDTWVEINQGINRREVRSIVVDPYDANTLYAAANGEVMKTTDGGKSWRANNGLNRGVVVLVIDPKDPQTLYAGAGGPKVFKTTDGGDHWVDMSRGLRTDDASITTLAISPADPNTLYVGTWFRGVYRTSHGGELWTATALANKQIGALAVDPQDPNTVYAGLFGGVLGSYAFRSTDGGDHWSNISQGLPTWGITALVVDPQDSRTLYASHNGRGIYKSFNGGDEWSAMSQGLTDRAVYSLAIDPDDTSILYAGTRTGVFKTTDAGGQWINTSIGLSLPVVSSLVIDPQNSDTIYAGTLTKSIFASYDGGQTWE